MQPRFALGKVWGSTPGEIALDLELVRYIHRHHCGDWGDELYHEDKQSNVSAIRAWVNPRCLIFTAC